MQVQLNSNKCHAVTKGEALEPWAGRLGPLGKLNDLRALGLAVVVLGRR